MRPHFIALCMIILLFASCQRDKHSPWTVGILNHAAVAEGSIDGFKDVMHEKGLVEGKDIRYIYSGPVAQGHLAQEATALVDQNVDMILTITMPATFAAIKARATREIPIIFAPNSNPVDANIVKSMEHPGDNITGVSFWIQEDKRLEWLRRILPEAQKITVPYMDWDRSPRIEIEKLKVVAGQLGFKITGMPISNPATIANAAASIPDDAQAIFIPADALIESNAKVFIEQAMLRDIPVTSPQSFGFSSGALMAYGFVQYETGRQGAQLALQVINGARAGDLPVEMAETRLMINLDTAAKLGIQIPPEIIGRADMLIR